MNGRLVTKVTGLFCVQKSNGLLAGKASYIGQRGESMMIREQILPLFGGRLRRSLQMAEVDYESLRELRLRVAKPVSILGEGGIKYLSEEGELTKNAKDAICPEMKELKSVVESACGYSGYAFEEEIKRGYLTIPGGHRMGLAGRAVMNGCEIQTLKHISALNLRIAHPVQGCGERWRK